MTDGRLPVAENEALANYRALVERDLVEPLERWCGEQENPLLRNAGVQLGICTRLLHEMTPQLHVLARESRYSPPDGPQPYHIALQQFLRLSNRYGGLVRLLNGGNGS